MQEYIGNHRVLPISLQPHCVRKERSDNLAVATEGDSVTSVGPGRPLWDGGNLTTEGCYLCCRS